MKKSGNLLEYAGSELELFLHAENWKRYFSSKLSKYIKGDVLEVGAGIGANTKYLIDDSINHVHSWFFIEPDSSLAENIINNIEKINIPDSQIINGTIDDIEPGKQFDCIIYIDVLEHIEKSSEEILKAKQLLKPQGYLIILVPAFNHLYNDFDKKIGHFRRYNKKLLLSEVNNVLKKERLYYLDSLGYFASLANKLVLKKSIPSLRNLFFWDKYLVNISKIADSLLLYSFGKSLIGVFQKGVLDR